MEKYHIQKEMSYSFFNIVNYTLIMALIFMWQLSISQSEAMIGAGDFFTAAALNNGTILTWGNMNHDPDDLETATNRSHSIDVRDLTGKAEQGIHDIAVGNHHILILNNDGTLLAWGDNQYGQLGDRTVTSKSHHVVVQNASRNKLTGIAAIAAGHSHSLALKQDGTLLAWGDNRRGQLGDGTTRNQLSPVHVRFANGTPLDGIIAVTAGWAHTLALREDGTLLAWGKNNYGQLGDGTEEDRIHPTVVKDMNGNPLSGIVKVAAGATHTIALYNNGSVIAWGDNREGQLGDGTRTTRIKPVIVSKEENIVIDISAGYYHSMALKTDGTLLSWGWNKFGQLGDGTSENRLKPVFVRNSHGNAMDGIIAMTGGASHTVVIGQNGELMAWGDNRYGQLGSGIKVTESNSPVMVLKTFATDTNKYYKGVKTKVKISDVKE